MQARSKSGIFPKKLFTAAVIPCTDDIEPTIVFFTFTNAKWNEVMQTEFEALQKNGTWSFVPSQPNNIL